MANVDIKCQVVNACGNDYSKSDGNHQKFKMPKVVEGLCGLHKLLLKREE